MSKEQEKGVEEKVKEEEVKEEKEEKTEPVKVEELEVEEPKAEKQNFIKKWISEKTSEASLFILFMVVIEIAMIPIYFFLVRNGQNHFIEENGGDVNNSTVGALDEAFDFYYKPFIDVSIMIFIGFGLLMSFYKFYGYNAIGMTFLISCLTAQYAIVVVGYAEKIVELLEGHHVDYFIVVDLPMMIKSLFAAGAVMISFGALIGKVSPFHLVVMTLIEIPVYALNVTVCEGIVGLTDVGGSFLVHSFGAYFGLFASWVGSSTPVHKDKKTTKLETASYIGDIFSLVGTIFLWILWPSFNGALEETFRHRIVINTYLSLIGSCIAAFVISRFIRGKVEAEDIQNATIAGGVIIGSCANLTILPGVAVSLGLLGGTISVLGYKYIKPLLQKIWLHDSCGVNNLHGIPGLIGALSSIFAVIPMTQLRWGNFQPLVQLGCLVFTLGCAIIGGSISGLFIRFVLPLKPKQHWNDSVVFEAELEEKEE